MPLQNKSRLQHEIFDEHTCLDVLGSVYVVDDRMSPEDKGIYDELQELWDLLLNHKNDTEGHCYDLFDCHDG